MAVDLMTLATSLSTIVSLLGLYRQEQRSEEDQGGQAFLRWLDEHGYQDLKESIQESHELSTAIAEALSQNHDVLLARLKNIDEILAQLLGHVEGMGGIALILHPNTRVPLQAINILRQLIQSGDKEFGKYEVDQGNTFLFFPSTGQHLQVEELRFIDDDLNTLVKLGFLLPRVTETGVKFWDITRNAVKWIESMDSQTT